MRNDRPLCYPEKDWLRVYTDGSQVDANTAGAGVHCKLFLQCATAGVNKSHFDGEIEAISLTTTAPIQASSI